MIRTTPPVSLALLTASAPARLLPVLLAHIQDEYQPTPAETAAALGLLPAPNPSCRRLRGASRQSVARPASHLVAAQSMS
jgi:hypothetical protein